MKRSRRGDLLVEMAQSPPASRPGSLRRRKTDELPLRVTEEVKAGEGSETQALLRARKSPEQLFRLEENGEKQQQPEPKRSRSVSNPPSAGKSASKPTVHNSRGMRMLALVQAKAESQADGKPVDGQEVADGPEIVQPQSSVGQIVTEGIKVDRTLEFSKWLKDSCTTEKKTHLLKILLEDKEVAAAALPMVLSANENTMDASTLVSLAKSKADLFNHLSKDEIVAKQVTSDSVEAVLRHVEACKLPQRVVDQALDHVGETNLGRLGMKFNLALSKGSAQDVSFSDCVSVCEALLNSRPGIRQQLLSSVPMSTLIDLIQPSRLPEFVEELKKKLQVASWSELRERLVKMAGSAGSSKSFQADKAPQADGKEAFVRILQGLVYCPNAELKALAEDIAGAIVSDRTQCAKFLNAIEHFLLFSV